MRVEEHLGPALGDVRQLRDRDRKVVGGEGDGLPVKVARGECGAPLRPLLGAILLEPAVPRVGQVGEEQRVVGRGVDLDLDDVRDMLDGLTAGAVYLWSASDRVDVLNRA